MLFSKNNCIHRICCLSYQFNNNYSYKLSFKLFFFLHIDNYAKKIIYATRDYLIIRVKILIHCNAIVAICIALVAIPGFMISVALSETIFFASYWERQHNLATTQMSLPQRYGVFSAIECGVTFPYKVVINDHSVTIKGNPILFICIQGFTQNFGISQPS